MLSCERLQVLVSFQELWLKCTQANTTIMAPRENLEPACMPQHSVSFTYPVISDLESD